MLPCAFQCRTSLRVLDRFASALQVTGVIHLAIEEEAQERADAGDARKTSYFIPGRAERGIDDVRCELERESGHEPTRRHQPDRPPILARGVGARQHAHDTE
jgi:hypothetical protein